jgi:16S rRNA (adenine1518-N6/adenine1519-N6)-dimethyltransferase
MTLNEMKLILAEGGIQLTRSLGQSFLHDANQLRRIVAAAELTRNDRVLEIGPGLGPLTELLVTSAGEVLAIEKDRRLADWLRRRQASSANLTLLEADAPKFLRQERRDWSGWKLVANLPYSVASTILVELAQAHEGPQRMVATLQLEVAQRLVARAGANDYGVLTLLVQLDYEPQGWFKIPASCFFPEPAVDSACVSLCRRAEPLLPAELRLAFAGIVKRGFSQRRKMMLKLLKADWKPKALEQAFASAALQPHVRAETVSLEQFVRLTRSLAADSGHG